MPPFGQSTRSNISIKLSCLSELRIIVSYGVYNSGVCLEATSTVSIRAISTGPAGSLPLVSFLIGAEFSLLI